MLYTDFDAVMHLPKGCTSDLLCCLLVQYCFFIFFIFVRKFVFEQNDLNRVLDTFEVFSEFVFFTVIDLIYIHRLN